MKSFIKITKAVAFPNGGEHCYLYESEIRVVRDVEALKRYYKANNINNSIQILNKDERPIRESGVLCYT